VKTKAYELCSSCRDIPWGNGMTIEEMLNVLDTDDRFKDRYSDDEHNVAVFTALYQYRDVEHCTRCWQLILDRLPSHMKGY